MARLPRLPPAVEHRFLKGACNLPPRLQRRLFGPPPSIDGQTLASDVHTMLALAKLSGVTSYTNGLPPAEARQLNRFSAAAAAAHPPIPMARVEQHRIPGEAGPIPARSYRPYGLRTDAPAPLLIYFHGGGWVVGDLETHDDVCRFLAANAGVAVLAVDYRLAPEHPFPAAVEDAYSAFLWAAAEGEALGIDPARIGVGGDSAGGNLAAVVGVLAREAAQPGPRMQLLLYPVVDCTCERPSRLLFDQGFLLTRTDMDLFESEYLPDGPAANDPRACLLAIPDLTGLPPAYIATAGFDPLRDEGEAFARRLGEAGVQVALRRHPGLIHGFASQTALSRSSRGAMREAAGALRMGLAPGEALRAARAAG